jgi:hypothetical protein
MDTTPAVVALPPATMLTAPPRPPVATPPCRRIAPLFPLTVVPVLNVTDPVTTPPPDNAFAVMMDTAPEPPLLLAPDDTTTDPPSPDPSTDPPKMFTAPPTPVALRMEPPCSRAVPPVPVTPSPTTMLILPARPTVAVPVRIDTGPVLLLTDVPELRVMAPEKPKLPTLADASTTDPDPEL